MKVILLVGLPGSGKSTYAEQEKLPVLSSDEVRKMLFDDITEQSGNRLVFALLRRLLRMRLELRRSVTCIDATSLTKGERRPYVRMAHMYGAEVDAVYFDVALAECKRRNLARDRKVPDEVMDRMAERLWPPSWGEGFTRIVVVGATTAAPEASPGRAES